MRTATARGFVLGTAAAALLLQAPRPARGDAGLTGATMLQIPLGSRAIGMGGAYAAVDGGLDSAGYNPAGLAAAKKPLLESTFTNGIAEDHFSFTGYAHPLSFGVLAAGAAYYDAGSVHLTLSNGTDETVKAEQDFMGMAGVGVPLGGGLSAGGLVKVFRLNLAQQASASGYAADAGVIWHSPVPGLNFGASSQNMGPDIKFEQQGDPLPLTARFGASYLLDLNRPQWVKESPSGFAKFQFTADGIKERDQRLSAAVGIEMLMPFGDATEGALRLGYRFNRDLDTLTMGIGMKANRFLLDYALGVERSINNVHNITIGVQF